ncbi:hypothetical protein D3C73_1182490 [compost metagenome]
MVSGQRLGHALHQPCMAELQGRQVNGDAPMGVAQHIPLTHLPAGFIEHPFTDRDDQPCFFGKIDELVWQQQALSRVLPAHQGLGPNGLTVAGIELGLVMQAELLQFHGTAQVLQQLQLFARVAVH